MILQYKKIWKWKGLSLWRKGLYHFEFGGKIIACMVGVYWNIKTHVDYLKNIAVFIAIR